MRLRAAYGIAFLALGASVLASSPPAAPRPGLYDPNPAHLWNRIHQQFRVRVAPDRSEWGFDRIDPLLRDQTRHLLSGPSHAAAVAVLDEFLTSHGERLIRDPLKRAVFQHDLWDIFDWAAQLPGHDTKGRLALLPRLARVMRRVALSKKDIEALPGDYSAEPALPRDLLDPSGPWVTIGGTQPVAAQHAGELSRSAFIVLWSVPGGAKPTEAYLQKLWTFPQPFVRDESFETVRDGEVRTKLNPALPAVPDGTRIALVRQMLLIDETGVIVPSLIVQSVQLRTFPGPAFAEITMSRVALFNRGSPRLRALTADDTDFLTFSSTGTDPFEGPFPRPPRPARVLGMCVNCHDTSFEPPVTTVRSVAVMLAMRSFADTRHERWARWLTQGSVAAEAKSRRFDWGLLQAWWHSAGE